MNTRRCIICGARVTNMNPKANTCSTLCTKAKHAGLTHQQMIEKIAYKEREPFPEHDDTGCRICGARYCICAER